MIAPPKKQFADAKSNNDLICIRTYSGYWSSAPDPLGKMHLFAPDVTDEVLGTAILDALACSRFLQPKDNKNFFDPQTNKLRFEEWVKTIMEHYGYKTRRNIFADMNSCGIERAGNLITFQPRCHVKPEVWDRKKSDNFEDVIIAADSISAEVGLSLRLAFSRCT